MRVETFPAGKYLYRVGEKPEEIFILLEGSVSVKLWQSEEAFDYATFGEWSLLNKSACEDVKVSEDSVISLIEPCEILDIENISETILLMLRSISNRLLIIDSELTGNFEVSETREDVMRTFLRKHPGAYFLNDKLFSDYLFMKKKFFEEDYKSALSISSKCLGISMPDDLKKEFLIWQTLASIMLSPDRMELLVRKLPLEKYKNNLSYHYLLKFIRGGKENFILDIFAKIGLHLPAKTILVLEGDVAKQGFLVVNGYVKAVKFSGDREIFLSLVKPGEFCGESAVFETGKRMATLYAVTPVDLIPFDKETLQNQIKKNPNFGLRLCKGQLERIEKTYRLLKIRATIGKTVRIEKVLQHLSEAIENAGLTIHDISNIAEANIEDVIEIVKKYGYNVKLDGVVGR
ncbi:cyclic nucleotide-binding domain-containing protein [Thermosipho ferrireducens]|uniref:Cyclic nucleotide-binding domain-containing protein n=1 Tax=Thermosipho ferrireducens TaxID=2571116 RepID=A0ABX7S815_9BACT|nr:cyclic nucleotide-binding domain-containing protein [Thermosipho ferrireducens]QTA38724.1 cyclic nucleotide-binding domain-containing protein [Thermosipho ferrireducens]